MKVLLITWKTLRELLRERMTVGLMLIFPVLLVGFYYVSFGQTEEGLAKYLAVLVLSHDEPIVTPEDYPWSAGTEIIRLMREAEFEGDPLFNVIEVDDRQTAEITLREHKASLLMEIPPDFTAALLGVIQGEAGAPPAEITLIGAPESGDYTFARSLLSGLIRQFALSVAGWEESVDLSYRFVPGTGTMSDFDYGVGGIIVFGVTFSVIIAAELMVREDIGGTLKRLRLTRVRAFDLLLGVTLAIMLVALVQVPITLGGALLMGFQNNGSLPLVLGIALLMSLNSVGIGLIVACFARTPADATNLASAVMVPLIFLTETMYPMPALPVGSIGDRTVQLYDFLPATHASEALRRVTIFGEGLTDITYELTMLVILSVILLAAGVVLYQRRRLSN